MDRLKERGNEMTNKQEITRNETIKDLIIEKLERKAEIKSSSDFKAGLLISTRQKRL